MRRSYGRRQAEASLARPASHAVTSHALLRSWTVAVALALLPRCHVDVAIAACGRLTLLGARATAVARGGIRSAVVASLASREVGVSITANSDLALRSACTVAVAYWSIRDSLIASLPGH